MNTMRLPPWPSRGSSFSSFTFFSLSSLTAASMSSTSKQMWKSPVPFSAIHFVTPDKPGAAVEQVQGSGRRRGNRGLQKIVAVQNGIRSRFVAVATLQQDIAGRPVVQAQPVQCENDSAGGATVRLADGSTDRIAWQSEEVYEQRGSDLASDNLQTDGLLALVRVNPAGQVVGYVLGEGTYLKWGDKVLVQATDSVCVSADADGAKVFGRRQSRKGLPTVEPVGVRAFQPTAR